MHINITTNSAAIDTIVNEVVKTKVIEGLSLDQWTIVLEICTYLEIPCAQIAQEINEKVRKITPAYRGLKLLKLYDRRVLLQKLDRLNKDNALGLN
jgi:hypothetical protein